MKSYEKRRASEMAKIKKPYSRVGGKLLSSINRYLAKMGTGKEPNTVFAGPRNQLRFIEEGAYYIYKVTRLETGEFYIGYHMGGLFSDYMGSGLWPREMRKARVKLQKQILSIHDCPYEARNAEEIFIREHGEEGVNPLCMNRSLRYEPFTRTRMQKGDAKPRPRYAGRERPISGVKIKRNVPIHPREVQFIKNALQRSQLGWRIRRVK